jgi:hypothetical protein
VRAQRVASKVGVLWGLILTASLPQLLYLRFGGQGGVKPSTFRFSGLGMRVRRDLHPSVTWVAALIRTPLNADEHMRMRPKMSPPLASTARLLTGFPYLTRDKREEAGITSCREISSERVSFSKQSSIHCGYTDWTDAHFSRYATKRP